MNFFQTLLTDSWEFTKHMTPDLVEDILEAMRFHPSVEAWDEPGTIVSMTTANGPCALKRKISLSVLV